MQTNEIRKKFTDYFVSKDHTLLQSSSLVPQNDETLLFTNSGMVQFKDIFLGLEKPIHKRATTVQRCVRAGGKHNDLEQVGYTARHHTYFEMLGNFSFGDYFKREAIYYAWNCLTSYFKIPESKLWVTIYFDDSEAESIWLNHIGINPMRLIKISSSDNFWQMGDIGPCGPCTEIFYDHGPTVPGGPPGSPDAHLDRFTEIWNVVFMEYFINENGNRSKLPKPSIDTGMGLERLASVIQGVVDNFDTDEFVSLKNKIIDTISISPLEKKNKIALNVISDHARAMVYLLLDDVQPSNEGKGYVLRRIIRRAFRYCYELGARDPMLHSLVLPVLSLQDQVYNQVRTHGVISVIKREEERFLSTLERGLKHYEQSIQQLSSNTLSGENVFKLYDTYGFPVDIIKDLSKERNINLDMESFNAYMEAQKQRGKKSSHFKAPQSFLVQDIVPTEFVGYQSTEVQSVALLTILVDNEQVSELHPKSYATIVLDKTPFYPESGGQAADQGEILFQQGVFSVSHCVAHGSLLMHSGYYHGPAELVIGSTGKAIIDRKVRARTTAHHSVTHLLHYALRTVLGTDTVQKGSLVTDRYTRFDFSHDGPVSKQALLEVESVVNEEIEKNSPTIMEITTPKSAIANGAIALFGEKYQEQVRVHTIGPSIELCGGTHVKTTGEIGCFTILDETAVAQGVRRITGVAMAAFYDQYQLQKKILQELAFSCSCAVTELPNKIITLLEKQKKIEIENKELTLKTTQQLANELFIRAESIRTVKFVAAHLGSYSVDKLKLLAEILVSKENNVFAILAVSEPQNENGIVVISVSRVISIKYSADVIAKKLFTILDAKGGGRQNLSQLGCEKISAFKDAVEYCKSWIINIHN
ncbi:MAG: alanine--tRNA ligase [Methylacidiphilales bacterium]|nr:alanine--tRNA ligase [Candidatus Methylacidiphilales bacterium]